MAFLRWMGVGGNAGTPSKGGSQAAYGEVNKSEQPEDRLFGMENFGNTCYANSILQALYFCPPFRESLVGYDLPYPFPQPASAPGLHAGEVCWSLPPATGETMSEGSTPLTTSSAPTQHHPSPAPPPHSARSRKTSAPSTSPHARPASGAPPPSSYSFVTPGSPRHPSHETMTAASTNSPSSLAMPLSKDSGASSGGANALRRRTSMGSNKTYGTGAGRSAGTRPTTATGTTLSATNGFWGAGGQGKEGSHKRRASLSSMRASSFQSRSQSGVDRANDKTPQAGQRSTSTSPVQTTSPLPVSTRSAVTVAEGAPTGRPSSTDEVVRSDRIAHQNGTADSAATAYASANGLRGTDKEVVPQTSASAPSAADSQDGHSPGLAPGVTLTQPAAQARVHTETLFTTLRDLFSLIRSLPLTNPSRQPSQQPIAPHAFVQKLKRENELFRSTMHQDAHEFLGFLLNRVAEDLEELEERRAKAARAVGAEAAMGMQEAGKKVRQGDHGNGATGEGLAETSTGSLADSASSNLGGGSSSLSSTASYGSSTSSAASSALPATPPPHSTSAHAMSVPAPSKPPPLPVSAATSAPAAASPTPAQASTSMSNAVPPPKTLIHKLFEGTLTNETRCLSCRTVTRRDESFLDLSVDIEKNASLGSCLRSFSEKEMLLAKNRFWCDRCGGLREAEKRMKIGRLPQVLALHLKRFKYQDDLKRYVKLAYRVPFPLELRLFNTTDDAEDPDRLYELFAVVVHIGSGPTHGHYIALVKCRGRWVVCDDDTVSSIDESELSKYFGDKPGLGSGYVLFYQAVGLDIEKLGLNRPRSSEPFEPPPVPGQTPGLAYVSRPLPPVSAGGTVGSPMSDATATSQQISATQRQHDVHSSSRSSVVTKSHLQAPLSQQQQNPHPYPHQRQASTPPAVAPGEAVSSDGRTTPATARNSRPVTPDAGSAGPLLSAPPPPPPNSVDGPLKVANLWNRTRSASHHGQVVAAEPFGHHSSAFGKPSGGSKEKERDQEKEKEKGSTSGWFGSRKKEKEGKDKKDKKDGRLSRPSTAIGETASATAPPMPMAPSSSTDNDSGGTILTSSSSGSSCDRPEGEIEIVAPRPYAPSAAASNLIGQASGSGNALHQHGVANNRMASPPASRGNSPYPSDLVTDDSSSATTASSGVAALTGLTPSKAPHHPSISPMSSYAPASPAATREERVGSAVAGSGRGPKEAEAGDLGRMQSFAREEKTAQQRVVGSGADAGSPSSSPTMTIRPIRPFIVAADLSLPTRTAGMHASPVTAPISPAAPTPHRPWAQPGTAPDPHAAPVPFPPPVAPLSKKDQKDLVRARKQAEEQEKKERERLEKEEAKRRSKEIKAARKLSQVYGQKGGGAGLGKLGFGSVTRGGGNGHAANGAGGGRPPSPPLVHIGAQPSMEGVQQQHEHEH